MRVEAINPESRRFKIYRTNLFWFRPLCMFIATRSKGLLSDELVEYFRTFGHFNFEVPEPSAIAIGRLFRQIHYSIYDKFVAELEKSNKHLQFDMMTCAEFGTFCLHCGGFRVYI